MSLSGLLLHTFYLMGKRQEAADGDKVMEVSPRMTDRHWGKLLQSHDVHTVSSEAQCSDCMEGSA